MGVICIKFLSNILITLLLVVMGSVSFADGSKVPPPKGDECVEDPEWMRSHHFETVLNHRDETVLKGIRTTEHSLKNCIECHITPNAQGEYARYSNSEEHFCASCHEYAAVAIDCFQCHADRPESAIRESIKNKKKGGHANPHHGGHADVNDVILNSKLLSAQ